MAVLAMQTDAGLVRLARAADGAAYGLLFERWFVAALASADDILANRQDSARVVTDAFQAAWQHLSRLDDDEQFGPRVLDTTRDLANQLLASRGPANPPAAMPALFSSPDLLRAALAKVLVGRGVPASPSAPPTAVSLAGPVPRPGPIEPRTDRVHRYELPSEPSPLVANLRSLRLSAGTVCAVGVILLGALIWFFGRGDPSPDAISAESHAPPAITATPATSEVDVGNGTVGNGAVGNAAGHDDAVIPPPSMAVAAESSIGPLASRPAQAAPGPASRGGSPFAGSTTGRSFAPLTRVTPATASGPISSGAAATAGPTTALASSSAVPAPTAAPVPTDPPATRATTVPTTVPPPVTTAPNPTVPTTRATTVPTTRATTVPTTRATTVPTTRPTTTVATTRATTVTTVATTKPTRPTTVTTVATTKATTPADTRPPVVTLPVPVAPIAILPV